MKKLTKLKALRTTCAILAVISLFLSVKSFLFILLFLFWGISYTKILEKMRIEEGQMLKLEEAKETREIKIATDRRLNTPHVQNDLYERSVE